MSLSPSKVPVHGGTLSLEWSQLKMADPQRRTMQSNIAGEPPVDPIGRPKRLRGHNLPGHFQRQGTKRAVCGTGRLIYHALYLACGVQKRCGHCASFPPLEYTTEGAKDSRYLCSSFRACSDSLGRTDLSGVWRSPQSDVVGIKLPVPVTPA
jgi:hypothetical protein